MKACSSHLRTLGQLRPQLNRRTANTEAVSVIQSSLDYCNSCILGLRQNTAARIVSGVRRQDHISPTLRDVHWLPVIKQIEHKIMLLPIFESLYQGMSHLGNCALHHSHSSKLPVWMDTKKKYLGVRSFESVAPSLWNNLSQTLRESGTRESFKKNLKTFLFG